MCVSFNTEFLVSLFFFFIFFSLANEVKQKQSILQNFKAVRVKGEKGEKTSWAKSNSVKC